MYKLRNWIDHEKLDWFVLSSNPKAIHLLEKHPEKISWIQLSKNHEEFHLLEQDPEKIDWKWLSGNPDAIHLLEQNQDKIDWTVLSSNTAIFVYDYDAMKETKHILHEEHMVKMFHPNRIYQFAYEYGIDIENFESISI